MTVIVSNPATQTKRDVRRKIQAGAQTTPNIEVRRLTELPADDLRPLLAESRAQGFRLLDTLMDNYANGVNRFAKPGEALFGVYHGRQLIAIGGLNRDPYVQDDARGRVRHVYVLDAWRAQGVGKRLMQAIVDEARRSFRLLTLRTMSAEADRFYRGLGFRAAPELEQATHYLVLSHEHRCETDASPLG